MSIVNLSLLQEAKAFLCWDVFPQLAIQLVPLQNTVAYYYPPDDNHSLVVFYAASSESLAEAFHLLFHEAGHIIQRQRFADSNRIKEFTAMIHLDKGEARQQFEREAWNLGRELLQRFLFGKKIATTIVLKQYEIYAGKCIYTYREE